MIEDTKILYVLQEILDVQREILDVLKEQGITVRKEYKRNTHAQPMSQEEKDDLDEVIDLDWWFAMFGEDPHPAKYMDNQRLAVSAAGQSLALEKRELDYLHKRLSEIAKSSPPVNGGTHVFKDAGKVYCKAEKNTLNCFVCVPVNKES